MVSTESQSNKAEKRTSWVTTYSHRAKSWVWTEYAMSACSPVGQQAKHNGRSKATSSRAFSAVLSTKASFRHNSTIVNSSIERFSRGVMATTLMSS